MVEQATFIQTHDPQKNLNILDSYIQKEWVIYSSFLSDQLCELLKRESDTLLCVPPSFGGSAFSLQPQERKDGLAELNLKGSESKTTAWASDWAVFYFSIQISQIFGSRESQSVTGPPLPEFASYEFSCASRAHHWKRLLFLGSWTGQKKKALWGVSCKLCITAQRPGPHFCEARPAAVKFRQGRKCFTAAHLGKTIQRMLQLYSTGWRRPSAARGKAASAEPPSGPHMKSTTLVSLMERRCCISEEVEAKLIHILSVCSNKQSPCSKTHWAWMRSWHQGKGNKMCSCGVGSISESDAEKRQMRWQARREETWGQLNPQNWQYVIYGHYCTERLQKQPFSISELHSQDSGRCCS